MTSIQSLLYVYTPHDNGYCVCQDKVTTNVTSESHLQSPPGNNGQHICQRITTPMSMSGKRPLYLSREKGQCICQAKTALMSASGKGPVYISGQIGQHMCQAKTTLMSASEKGHFHLPKDKYNCQRKMASIAANGKVTEEKHQCLVRHVKIASVSGTELNYIPKDKSQYGCPCKVSTDCVQGNGPILPQEERVRYIFHDSICATKKESIGPSNNSHYISVNERTRVSHHGPRYLSEETNHYINMGSRCICMP